MNINESRKEPRESGFSLIEVLIVLVVIAVLAAIAIVALADALDRAKQRATMADMRSISKAIESYRVDTGHYPASGQTMSQVSATLVPYQSSVLPTEDHWKHSYIYTTDNLDSYSIESYGKDGADGVQIDYSTRFEFDRDIILTNGVFVASPEG